MLRTPLAIVSLFCTGALGVAPDRAIATGGNPASMVVFGDAEAVGVLADGTVLAARVRVGAGRAAALGHGGFLSDERAETRAFVTDQLAWLLQNNAGRAWGLPGPLQQALADRGIETRAAPSEPADLVMSAVDLIVGSPQAFERAGRLDDLRDWLRAGGSLLSVETAWGQLQLGHADSVEDLAANRLLGPHGIIYTDRALSPNRDGVYPLDPDASANANAGDALAILADPGAPGDRTRAARTARAALAVVPLDSPLIRRADQLAAEHRADLAAVYAGMADRPLKLADHPLACALLDLEARRAAADPTSADAHPSAAAFPGAIPDDAPRVTATVTLDEIPGWRTTGLYAPPGETVTIRVTAGEADGAHAQVGAWLDPQDFDDRHRMPIAVYRSPVVDDRAAIASPIGGPVYIDLPESADPRPVTVEITGAVEMPRYRLGHTDLTEWQTRLRGLPAPWVELESDELAFTLPADAIRDLDRPDLVMQHWDRVHHAMQSMEPRSPRHWPDRQYRYVAERRLSWGYMYCPSGSPIVIPMNEARPMVDVSNFDAEGDNQLWGHYHEMGHSHQNPLWTFAGTGEVTVNIFTVLALNTINGYPLDNKAMRTEPGGALARMIDHRSKGAPFDKWKSDPFLALQTYALIWHAFGWDAFRDTFRSYDTLAPDQHPENDQAQRDLLVTRLSRTVGHNLAPYFDAWGVPISGDVNGSLADLPEWMPEGL